MVQEAPNAVSLLEELRGSQAAVAGEIAAFSINLAPLSEAVTAIANALSEAQQTKAEIAVEKLTALNTIQTRLEEAVAVIRVVAQETTGPDPFTEPHRMGGPQAP